MSADLQRLYHLICDEEWDLHGYFRPTGYQARAAAEVGRRVGRKIVEEEKLFRLLRHSWPPNAIEAQEAFDLVHQLRPTIRGNTKTFYVVRDVLLAIRGIKRRPICATCNHRYHPDDEYREREHWWSVVWSSSQRVNRKQWSCSFNCFRKAQKKLDKEIEWLKIGNQRIKEARKLIRQAARNPVAHQSSDART